MPPPKKRTAWQKTSRRGERRCRKTRKKELTSLLEMAKENGVGWRKEKVLTKAEETETANVNAAWAKMKALEAKLEADELKSMSLEDAKK